MAAISAGGHVFRINYNADKVLDKLCLTLQLLSKRASSVKAVFEVLLIDKDGIPAVVAEIKTWQLGTVECIHTSGVLSLTDLVKKYVKDGQIKFLCTITTILNDDSSIVPARTSGTGIRVPTSDLIRHLGTLLDTADGTDLAFTIDGETFNAHRAILAARSPVFRAELLGSMAEATMTSITLHDIAPATFKAMLRFMYTDALPKEDELGDSPLEMFEHLLAAADWYALDRLKLLCAQKLWDNVSVDTVATTLACAQMYSCLELKEKCISFFMVDKHFKKAVLTEGFVKLMQQDPSIIIELRDRTQT